MNNVYVRSNKSIKSISLGRIAFLLPLIIYGCYKNGLYLYLNKYVGIFGLIKPLIYVLGGGLVGILVNIIYEKIFKHNKGNLSEIIFSSFHFEYGIILGCITSINTNLIVFFSVVSVLLFLSKFTKNRINVECLIFLIIYLIINNTSGYDFANAYEATKVFNLGILDYLFGHGPGGIACTHVLFALVALIGLALSSNSKSRISFSAIIAYCTLAVIYRIITPVSFSDLLFSGNVMFAFIYLATDYGSSSYTNGGMLCYGILIGVLSFTLRFIDVNLAPIIAILFISLFNVVIDRQLNRLKNRK